MYYQLYKACGSNVLHICEVLSCNFDHFKAVLDHNLIFSNSLMLFNSIFHLHSEFEETLWKLTKNCENQHFVRQDFHESSLFYLQRLPEVTPQKIDQTYLTHLTYDLAKLSIQSWPIVWLKLNLAYCLTEIGQINIFPLQTS